MSRPNFHSLIVTAVRPEGDDAVSVEFEVPPHLRAEFAYTPGQYLTVRRIGDSEQRRSYSLCSSPGDGKWRIGIRELPGGAFSTWANRALEPGMQLECMPPEGRFCPTLEPSASKHFVLFAVGSGITPCLSIAKSVLATAPYSRVTLLYGNRRTNTAMFREDLEDLKNRYLDRFALHCLFSREDQDIPLHHGRLDAAKVERFLEQLIPPRTIDEAFICGPGPMLNEVAAALRKAGIADDHIHVERFGTEDLAPLVRPEGPLPASASVTVIVDGGRRELRFNNPALSILDTARAAGLDLPFSCKSGVCATCRARVIEGEVRMARNFALLKSDIAAGIVLSCQARPVTARVVLSFDDR